LPRLTLAMAQGKPILTQGKTMAHAAHTVTTDGVGPAEHHAFDQTGLFATVCRALSIVSGGFLLGTNQGWGALVGLGLGLSAWLANRSRYSP
jgi:hypothetical protein